MRELIEKMNEAAEAVEPRTPDSMAMETSLAIQDHLYGDVIRNEWRQEGSGYSFDIKFWDEEEGEFVAMKGTLIKKGKEWEAVYEDGKKYSAPDPISAVLGM